MLYIKLIHKAVIFFYKIAVKLKNDAVIYIFSLYFKSFFLKNFNFLKFQHVSAYFQVNRALFSNEILSNEIGNMSNFTKSYRVLKFF